MRLAPIKKLAIILLLTTAASSVFADDAPVYDADNFPPQFDGQPTTSATTIAANSEGHYIRSQTLTQEQRLSRLEQQIKNLSHSDAASKTDAMQDEIQSLRGQVEELSHQLQQIQNQQRAMYTELDKRITQPAIEKKAPAVTSDNDKASKKPAAVSTESAASTDKATTALAKVSSNTQPNSAEEQQIYQTAYDLIKAKKYSEAVNTLQKMLQKYPSGQFAANAHYWLGELYGLLNKNDQSANEFAAVVKGYPDSPKVADAQLKLGLIYAGQFKWPDAKSAFKKVIAHYPGTASARLASEQLKQLKQAQAQAQAQAGR